MSLKRLLLSVCVCTLAIGFSESTWADSKPEEIPVATWNLFWFYDHNTSDNSRDLAKEKSAPDAASWTWKVKVVGDAIAEMKPTIIGLQEIENEKVLKDLAKYIKDNHNITYKVVFVQGKDTSTEQDVGILALSGFKSVRREDWPKNNSRYKIPTKHLIAEFEWSDANDVEKLTVIVVHFTASGGTHQRVKQGKTVRLWIEDSLAREDNVIVMGDYNTHKPLGDPTANYSAVGALDGHWTSETYDDLYDLHNDLSPNHRITHRHGDHLDRILISQALLTDWDYNDLNYDSVVNRKDLAIRGGVDMGPSSKYWDRSESERDVSDHYPVMVKFTFID